MARFRATELRLTTLENLKQMSCSSTHYFLLLTFYKLLMFRCHCSYGYRKDTHILLSVQKQQQSYETLLPQTNHAMLYSTSVTISSTAAQL